MNCEQCLHREEGVQVLLPITRPPEHSAVAGLLPELPVAGVIFDIFVLEVHVEVFDAAFSVRDLKVQEDQVGNLTPDFGGIRRFFSCCSADFGPRLPANQVYNNQNIDELPPKSGVCRR